MSQEQKPDIICDGLLKGNVDVTDDAQAALQQHLLDQEMRRMFPGLFIDITPIS